MQLMHKRRRRCKCHTANRLTKVGGCMGEATLSLYHSHYFLKHVEEALAHPYHTHISAFANQMSWLEKAELS